MGICRAYSQGWMQRLDHVGDHLALASVCSGASYSNRWVLVVAPLWTSFSLAPLQPLLLSPLFWDRGF